ncbi:hypothetical protein V1477_011707 [Vespula maculifrons]|uniref:Uncharacterized protein n=1 Tax=Vespula maculifrons TaxID=7453 RepID=A0ABD2C1M1_VESMC
MAICVDIVLRTRVTVLRSCMTLSMLAHSPGRPSLSVPISQDTISMIVPSIARRATSKAIIQSSSRKNNRCEFVNPKGVPPFILFALLVLPGFKKLALLGNSTLNSVFPEEPFCRHLRRHHFYDFSRRTRPPENCERVHDPSSYYQERLASRTLETTEAKLTQPKPLACLGLLRFPSRSANNALYKVAAAATASSSVFKSMNQSGLEITKQVLTLPPVIQDDF